MVWKNFMFYCKIKKNSLVYQIYIPFVSTCQSRATNNCNYFYLTNNNKILLVILWKWYTRHVNVLDHLVHHVVQEKIFCLNKKVLWTSWNNPFQPLNHSLTHLSFFLESNVYKIKEISSHLLEFEHFHIRSSCRTVSGNLAHEAKKSHFFNQFFTILHLNFFKRSTQ